VPGRGGEGVTWRSAAAAIAQPKDLARAKGKVARLRGLLVHAAIVDHCSSSDAAPRGWRGGEGQRGREHSGSGDSITMYPGGCNTEMLINQCAAREMAVRGGGGGRGEYT